MTLARKMKGVMKGFPCNEASDRQSIQLLLPMNDTLYNDYFWWKPHFIIRNRLLLDGIHYNTFCSLSAALHNPDKHTNKQTPFDKDVQGWWKEKSRCRKLSLCTFVEAETGLPYFHGIDSIDEAGLVRHEGLGAESIIATC